jgi:protein-L-isoaspartate(D-aspartate) O-methyltransferase
MGALASGRHVVNAVALMDSWTKPYADDLVAREHIRSKRVRRAFRRVPRHRFIKAFYARGRRIEVPQGWSVPDAVLQYLYSDSAPVTDLVGDRPVISVARPAVIAEMLEALDLRRGQRVLEIGTGTGYTAALVAEITGAQVVTIDNIAEVADEARTSLGRIGEERVTVLAGEGFNGYADRAPYDRVIVSVGTLGIAEPWLDQLALGGLIVAPVLVAGSHPVLRVRWGPPWTASGHGVCWTDVEGGEGALVHRDRISNRPLNKTISSRSTPRIVRQFSPSLDDHEYEGLSAYLTLANRAGEWTVAGLGRPGGRCTIRDPDGAIAVVQPAAVLVDGPDEFAKQVALLTRRWLRLRTPRFTAWTFDLTREECPAGWLWRPYHYTILEGDALVDNEALRAVAKWLVGLAVDIGTEGPLAGLLWYLSDLARKGSDRPGEPFEVSVSGALDLAASAVEQVRDFAGERAGQVAAAAVRRAGAPDWVADLAGHVLARLALGPVDRPMQMAGLLLRVAARSIETELSDRRLDMAKRADIEQVLALVRSEGFKEELRQLVTEGLRAESDLVFRWGPRDLSAVRELLIGDRAKSIERASRDQELRERKLERQVTRTLDEHPRPRYRQGPSRGRRM